MSQNLLLVIFVSIILVIYLFYKYGEHRANHVRGTMITTTKNLPDVLFRVIYHTKIITILLSMTPEGKYFLVSSALFGDQAILARDCVRIAKDVDEAGKAWEDTVNILFMEYFPLVKVQ